MTVSFIKRTTLLPYTMAFKVITQRAEQWLQRSVGCGRRELWVLLCVQDNQLSQRQIGEAIRLGANSVVKILDKMEDANLIRRVRKPSDRRESIVEVTPKGRQVREKILLERADAMRQIFEPLSDEQIALWESLSLEIIRGVAPVVDDSSDSDG